MWSHTTGRYVAAFEEELFVPIWGSVVDSLSLLLRDWLLLCSRADLGLLAKRAAFLLPCDCGTFGPGLFGLRGLLVW